MDSLPESLRALLTFRFGARNWQAVEPKHRGMSGLPLFQLVTREGSFALRAWPSTSSTIHKVGWWSTACTKFQDAGYESESPIPRPLHWHGQSARVDSPLPATVIQSANWYWTLSSWVPGVPLSISQLTCELRGELMELLGEMHRVCRTIACTDEPSRGVQERWDALQDGDWDTPVRGVYEADASRYAAFVRAVSREVSDWKQLLRAWKHRPTRQHWIVRDLWRENVLVSSDLKRMWVVDIGASRVEAPLFDLIRLLGSLHITWDQWRAGIQTYADVSGWKLPLTTEDLWLLHRGSVAISIRHWNRKLSVESEGSDERYLEGWERFRELLTIWELSEE